MNFSQTKKFLLLICFIALSAQNVSADYSSDFAHNGMSGWLLTVNPSYGTAFDTTNGYAQQTMSGVFSYGTYPTIFWTNATTFQDFSAINSWSITMNSTSTIDSGTRGSTYVEWRFLENATAFKSIRITHGEAGNTLCLLYDSISASCLSSVAYTNSLTVNVIITKQSTVYNEVFYNNSGGIIAQYSTPISNNIANPDRTSLYNGIQSWSFCCSYINDNVQSIAKWNNVNLFTRQLVGAVHFGNTLYYNYQTGSLFYILNSPNFLLNSYRIVTENANTLEIQDTFPLSSSSGTLSIPFSAYQSANYYAVLQYQVVGNSTWVDSAYDITQIVSTVFTQGYTYNAETGAIIPSVNVNETQQGNWFNTTSNITGFFNESGMVQNQNITVNASKTNFTHVPFTWFPLAPVLFNQSVYLFPTNITRSSGGVEGMVLDNGVYQGITSATIQITNGTYTANTTSNSLGYYNFSGLANGIYTVTGFKTGLSTIQSYTVTVSSQTSWAIQNIILNIQYAITIHALDSVSTAQLSTFTACISGTCTPTVNGEVIFHEYYGSYYIATSASGYYSGSDTIILFGDTIVDIPMVLQQPSTQSSTLFQTVPHDVTFIVQDLMFNKKVGITVVAQGMNTSVGSFSWLSTLLGVNFATTPINNASMNGTTGTDGTVDFKMDGSIYYVITFSGNGVNMNWSGYPTQYSYLIIVPTTFTGTFNNGTDVFATVSTNVSSHIVNASTAIIYANYTDTLNQTSGLTFYLNQSILGDPYNQTNIQIINGGTNGTFSAAFTVSPYSGNGYVINVVANHVTLGSISSSYGVQFPIATPFSKFNPISVLMLGVGLILFVAGFFGQTSTEQGAAVIVGLCWLLDGIAVWASLNSITLHLALTLATVVVILMNVNAKSRSEGIS